jgi:hypothetical protein
MLRSIASTSFGPNGGFIRAVQSRGRLIGQGVKVGCSTPSSARRAEKLPHLHCSALDQVRPQRVPFDVAAHRREMRVRLHRE